MKNKTANILCAFLGLLFGGVFWWSTHELNPHMWILRAGFTLSLMCLGVAIGCVIHILTLGE